MADRGGDADGSEPDADAVPFGGADRPELAATTVAMLCAIAFMTFATLEVLVLDPGLGRLSAAVALAPLAGGWITTNVGIEWVFYLGGASAFTGVFAFLGILSYSHGRQALSAW